jgi:hypothetical protein
VFLNAPAQQPSRGKCVYNESVNLKAQCPLPPQKQQTRRTSLDTPSPFLLTFVLVALLASRAAASDPPPASEASNRKDLVSAVKRLEKKLGLKRTKNFKKETAETAVAYRCYYTGKLELPDSYDKLQLLQGTKVGCPLDATKYDVLFYPMDANASGKTPVTASLARESVERFLVVVPHEDFHANQELQKLPAPLSEAASTLVGFLTATEVARQKFGEESEVYQNLRREPELFSRKADIVNRYHARLSRLYAAVRSGETAESNALAQKQQIFAEIQEACKAIQPDPKSFGKCLSVSNNAGLAFDATYTRYYPLMYDLYVAESRKLKPTLDALQRALNTKTETGAVQSLQDLIKNLRATAAELLVTPPARAPEDSPSCCSPGKPPR